MGRHYMIRFAAVLVAAAVLFGLEQEFGLKIYLAFPAALAAYLVTLVALGLAFGSDRQTK